MKFSSAVTAMALQLVLQLRVAHAQSCAGVSGQFVITDITGDCTYDTILHEYARQVFDVTGSTCSAGSTLTAQEDLDAKLIDATGAATALEGAMMVCKAMYDAHIQTPFTNAADKGDDLHFEQMFYNGRSDWQEEVETIYETEERTPTSVLKQDAAKVREFYLGDGSYSRVTWPDSLTNFEPSTCDSHAAMCCWPKDRQANDGNGNCATPYDENCVDKDPADNTNLCFTDLAKGNLSTGFDSEKGFLVYPDDNGDGEGAIHCHGFAWADDEYDSISRYKANNLFFVSMYDHMHQRGYVKNIPGAPMCGCMEQMPIATRSDCTQVDLTEDWSVTYDGTSFTGHLEKVEIDFNACQGRNNRNNNLWAYAARLYDEGRMTRHQFGAVGRVLTNDGDCYTAVEYEKAKKGFIAGYDHDQSMWTKVAARDDMKDLEPFGREAFNKAFFVQNLDNASVIMRTCPDCIATHRRVYYRRLTPVGENFDLLHHLLYYRNSNANPNNVWGEGNDFTLHSSYDDAVSGANPWQCPNNNFNYHVPFDGECSPDGRRETNQYSIFSWYPGPRSNVGYYVNKPQDDGVQSYADNGGVTRAVGLTDIDVGEVGIPGTTLEDNGVYHITGSGEDIWGHSDQFHYKSQPYEGDIDVRVHVTDFANNGGHSWAKTGIMLRADNSPDATFAFNCFAAQGLVSAQHRRSKGAHAGSTGSTMGSNMESVWLRLVKKMEDVEFYYSTTGEDDSWITMAKDSIFFPEDQYRVGLAVTSNYNHYLAEATFEDYTIQSYSFPTSAPSLSSAPTGWNAYVDIGEPQRAGESNVSPDGNIEYVKGSGEFIWGTSDMFYFVNDLHLAGGDMSVELYINKFDNNEIRSRGGIMIRDSLDADAANVFVGASGADQGAVFQSRPTAGADTVHHKAVYVNSINQFWVKVDKVGTLYTASYKVLEGDAWIELGSTEMASTGTTVNVGRAVTAGTPYQWALVTMETGGALMVSATS